MRIIAGAQRNHRLNSPEGTKTRPTAERVREAVLNTLNSMNAVHDEARFLDMFAGSGAVGLEALSRGIAHCTFCEQDLQSFRCLQTNIEMLGYESRAQALQVDAFRYIETLKTRLDSSEKRPFTVIFADPPYGFDDWEKLIIAVADLCEILVCEAAKSLEPVFDNVKETLSQGEFIRARRYGSATVTVFDCNPPAKAQDQPTHEKSTPDQPSAQD